MTMNDYVQRMIDEHKQLKERVQKLDKTLMQGDALEKFGVVNVKLMAKQLIGMEIYEDTLATRLLQEHIDPYGGYIKID